MDKALIVFSKDKILKVFEETIKQQLGIKKSLEIIQIEEMEVKELGNTFDIWFILKDKNGGKLPKQ